jgi:hypothetical protein
VGRYLSTPARRGTSLPRRGEVPLYPGAESYLCTPARRGTSLPRRGEAPFPPARRGTSLPGAERYLCTPARRGTSLPGAERYLSTPAQHIHTPQVQIMPPNTDNAHNKYNCTIICNVSQVQLTAPLWWILRDPKHVGAVFRIYFFRIYFKQYRF